MNDLKGKRLLVLAGVNPIAADVVQFAKRMGVYTIVTGNLDVTLTPAKRFADQIETVSTADLDALEALAKEVKADGIMTGSSEFSIEMTMALCKRLNKPFYCTKEQWDICSNKNNFKELCRTHHVPVVHEFHVEETDEGIDCSSLIYPVIVKPVDGSGGGGISVCNDEEAFLAAYERAKSYSPTGSVIIETYVISDEIGISYAIQNGKVYLTAMHDRYLRESDGNFMKLPLAYIYPSKHLQFYQETQNQKVVEMFESIGLQNGTLFIQGFATENECPFYEMGYRFNGAKQYNLLKEENGFSTMDMMIHHALTGEMNEPDLAKVAKPDFDHVYCTLFLLGRPGHVEKVIGVEELRKLPEIVDVSPWYYGGEDITEKLMGTQRQILCRVTLKTEDRVTMAKAIDTVYEIFEVLDDKGESMLLDGFDSKLLLD